nr:expressed protein [Hymenolepis microstoma]
MSALGLLEFLDLKAEEGRSTGEFKRKIFDNFEYEFIQIRDSLDGSGKTQFASTKRDTECVRQLTFASILPNHF